MSNSAAPPIPETDEWAMLVMNSKIMSKLHRLHESKGATPLTTYFWCGLREDVAPITRLIIHRRQKRHRAGKDETLNTCNWTQQKNADAVRAAANGSRISMGFYGPVRLVFVSRRAWHTKHDSSWVFKSGKDLEDLMSNQKGVRITFKELRLARQVADQKGLKWELLEFPLVSSQQYAYLYTLVGYSDDQATRPKQHQYRNPPATTPNGVSARSRYRTVHGGQKLSFPRP